MWLFTVKYLDFFKNRILIQGLLIYIKKKRGIIITLPCSILFFGGGVGRGMVEYCTLNSLQYSVIFFKYIPESYKY